MKYMELDYPLDKSDIILVGIPYDGTTSYRSGAKFAPMEIRLNSLIGYETYSPTLNKDLDNLKLYDAGDIEVPYTAPQKVQEVIQQEVTKYLQQNKKIAVMGGEHSISLGVIRALREKYGSFKVIQFDAHTDLREDYLGDKYSHACVMKRICEEVGAENVCQFGIRSGLQEEFEYAKHKLKNSSNNFKELENIIKEYKDEKVYITIDLDVLDPAFMPGTGTPEPNGVTTREFFDAIYKLRKLNKIIGFDIVELAPKIDNTQISTAVAIKTLREMLLIL
ncbi:MAG: agmatinase [Mycoplasmatales bacterium]